jgi:hypothetical protein
METAVDGTARSEEMKERITEIIAGLTDEMNIQPIVHNLFEKADSEEVKRTVENLKRTLEYKNEEVKKSLSANHEHLFTCTDLVEQLRDFSALSSQSLAKIKSLNLKLSEASKVAGSPARSPSSPPQSFLSVSSIVFYREVLAQIQLVARQNCATALALLCAVQQSGKCPDHLLRCCWTELIKEAGLRLAACLRQGTDLSKPCVSNLHQLFSIGWNGFASPESPKTALRTQAVWAVIKPWGCSLSLERFREASNPTQGLSLCLRSILDHVSQRAVQIDVVELLKILARLDAAEHVSLTADASSYADILLQLFNFSLGNLSSDYYQRLCAQCDGLYRLAACGPASEKFVSLYTSYIPSLISSIHLIQQGAKETLSPLSFNFKVVRRFYKNRQEVERWESALEIGYQYTLRQVIAANWNTYCERVVGSLEKSLDFVALAKELPRSGPKDSSSLQYLDSCLQAVLASSKQVSELIAADSIPSELADTQEFRNRAILNFEEALRKNFAQVIGAVEPLSGQPDSLRAKSRLLFFIHFLLADPDIRPRLEQATLDSFDSAMEQTYRPADQREGSQRFSAVLGTLELLFNSELNLDLTHLRVGEFITRVQSAVGFQRDRLEAAERPETAPAEGSPAAAEVLRQLRISFPSVVPFTISARLDPPQSLQGPPQLQEMRYDELTHGEMLSHYKP